MARSYGRINWNGVSRDCPMYSCELIYWISCCAHSTAFKFNKTAERSLALCNASIFRSITRSTDEKVPSAILPSSCKKKRIEHLCNSRLDCNPRLDESRYNFGFDTKLYDCKRLIKAIPFSWQALLAASEMHYMYIWREHRDISRTASQELNAQMIN